MSPEPRGYSDYVIAHPYTQSDPDIRKAAENVITALADLYQLDTSKNPVILS